MVEGGNSGDGRPAGDGERPPGEGEVSPGEGTEPGVAVERRSPEAAFALLADETRLGILRALGETPDEAVPFGRLRERVGAADSGGFNYHLRKLVGSFVRRTDAGYRLTHAGRAVLGAMYAGTYTADATVGAIPVEGECPNCGGRIVAEYADETATTVCTDCGEWHNEFAFPPGSVEAYDRAELPAAFDRWMRHVFRGILAGFCETCDGRIEGRLVVDGEGAAGADDDGDPVHVVYDCRRCGSRSRTSAGFPALVHPAVEGFLHDHGFGPDDPTWVVLAGLDGPTVSVRSTDPPVVAVEVVHGGERAVALLGPDGTVQSVERSPVGGEAEAGTDRDVDPDTDRDADPHDRP